MLLTELSEQAAEQLRGPWRAEAYDNMADAYCVEGQVEGEGDDQYPHDDPLRHTVRAEAVQRIPEMVAALGKAADLAGNWEHTDSLEYEVWASVGALFGALNEAAEDAGADG